MWTDFISSARGYGGMDLKMEGRKKRKGEGGGATTTL